MARIVHLRRWLVDGGWGIVLVSQEIRIVRMVLRVSDQHSSVATRFVSPGEATYVSCVR